VTPLVDAYLVPAFVLAWFAAVAVLGVAELIDRRRMRNDH